MICIAKGTNKKIFFLIVLMFLFVAPIFYASGTTYWKIKITVAFFRMDDRMDGLADMEVGFTFYINGYQNNHQFCVFTKEDVKRGTEYENPGYWTYTTVGGYPTNAQVVWYFYEDDSNPLDEFNGRDALAVFAGGENPYVFYVTGTDFTWVDPNNPDDHGEVEFSVDFTLTGYGPPE